MGEEGGAIVALFSLGTCQGLVLPLIVGKEGGLLIISIRNRYAYEYCTYVYR